MAFCHMIERTREIQGVEEPETEWHLDQQRKKVAFQPTENKIKIKCRIIYRDGRELRKSVDFVAIGFLAFEAEIVRMGMDDLCHLLIVIKLIKTY